MRAAGGSERALGGLDDPLNAFERTLARTNAFDKEAAAHFAGRLALYRALAAAVKQVSSESMRTTQDRHEARISAAEKDADSGAEVALKESRH
jgi:hypothetical protein